MRNIIQKVALFSAVCAASASAIENISNYSAPITVSAFLQWGDTLYAASSGGFIAHDLKNGVQNFAGNGRVFPDLYLTSLCRDNDGNIWIGSRKGYLYKRTPRGQYTSYSTYKLSGWGITALYYYDGMVVVGSDKGVSLFDPVKGVAVRNATGIARFANPRVNAIEASGDTLFLGCAEGVAFLDSLYDAPLAQRNFYFPGIWKTKGLGPAVSFVDTYDSIAAFSKPAAYFRGYLFTADSGGWLTSGGARYARATAYGNITTLYNEGERLWIGTDETFYYSWDGQELPKQHAVPGYTLRKASRVLAAPNGDVWVLPIVTYPNISWYHGIYRFDGAGWQLYNEQMVGYSFGYIGDAAALGAAFWKDSSLWVGTSGGNVKHIDPARGAIGQLISGNRDFAGFSYIANGWGNNTWGRTDAIAADSSGYLWISVYDSDFGSLICYDPRDNPISWEKDPAKAHFRRFFTEPPLKTTNVEHLAVDARGRIFAYDASQNRVVAFSHNGSPLTDGIKIDTVYETVGMLHAMEVGADGAVYIADGGGIKKIPVSGLAVETVDNAIAGVSSMAVGEGILWVGTLTSGILRCDLTKNERRWIGESDGLPSNNVTSIALDRKNGRLWAVTEDGVSMLYIGREGKSAPKPNLRVIPNVFSVSGSARGASQITFAGLEPKSSVSVYTLNGALAGKAEAQYYSDNEWRAAWAPKKSLAPGTYFAVVKPGGKKAKIILKP
ncbi:MAG: hypothetical protein LBH93_03950 [Chitinispirillales bacterium]|nr:hypothetical protein [Chitinispirillales bacterium]